MPAVMNAGVILKKNGERIENVSIKQVTATEVVYIASNGEEMSILKSDVAAILYDDGRYEEIRQTTSGETSAIESYDTESTTTDYDETESFNSNKQEKVERVKKKYSQQSYASGTQKTNEINELRKMIKTDDALKIQYDQIVYDNRFTQGKYLIPFISGTAVGAAMMICGYLFGIPVLPSAGGVVMLASLIAPPVICVLKRNSQLKTLYNQCVSNSFGNNEIGFSLMPFYTPENKGCGLSFSMTF